MHDVAVKTKKYAYPLPRRANECVADPAFFVPPQKLFDEFWREGEMALMFGAPSTGKTVLAVQIAEALAAGEPVDGFDMPDKGRRVLYVDMVHSGAQFHIRRTRSDGRPYKFSNNLDRDAPPTAAVLIDWLREVVIARRYRVVIIDDLTAFRSAYDGTRETLKLMRELRPLMKKLGFSVLLITQSRPPRSGEAVGEANLMRSRILCDVADSVFAIGRHAREPEWLYLIQTRSRSAPIAWNANNSPFARVRRRDDGLVALHFDDRFEPKLDAKTLALVRQVKALQLSGLSLTKISRETGLSRSRVERLLKKWRPGMGERIENSELRIENLEDEVKNSGSATCETALTCETSEASEVSHTSQTSQTSQTVETSTTSETSETSETSVTSEILPETMEDIFRLAGCRADFDAYGKRVWVEKVDERGKNRITYTPTNIENRYTRWKYDMYGPTGSPVNGPVTMLNDTG